MMRHCSPKPLNIWRRIVGEKTKIEWCDMTWNPWIGCQHVSPGCDNCYAETQNAFRKWNGGTWGTHAPRKRTSPANWKLPLRWAKAARMDQVIYKGKGFRPRVFCASLADWLDNQVPQRWRVDLAHLIHDTPELDWLLLTKRIENFSRLSPWPVSLDEGGQIPFPDNVWLGITAEDQLHYDKRWGILRQIPATVHFISYEPALGPLSILPSALVPDWIICGGESGAKARYMHPTWAAMVRDQCKEAGVAFFMKQMSSKEPIPRELLVRQFPRLEARVA
jgi:protein gp37